MKGHLYLALVHHPVRGRSGDEITTSVTNLDVHDIARTARTYDVKGYYVVTPVTAQRDLVNHILGYWREGKGGDRVPERTEALSIVEDIESIEAAIAAITAKEGRAPRVVTTAAKARASATSFDALRAEMATHEGPYLLMFGTGYGLADRVLEKADVHLAPVRPGGYNHLPVRCAVAIILDRLIGDA